MTPETDWPTPGPNEPVPESDEYQQLRDAVHNYLDHQPDDPAWDDIWGAFGAIWASINAMPSPKRSTSTSLRRQPASPPHHWRDRVPTFAARIRQRSVWVASQATCQ